MEPGGYRADSFPVLSVATMKQTTPEFNRREFVTGSSALIASLVLPGLTSKLVAAAAPSDGAASGRGRIFKAVKWGMIGTHGTVLDKFKLQKELGYDGMELVSPWDGDA